MEKNLMKGNKDPNYQLKVTEAGSYHVEFKRRMLPRGGAFEGELRKLKQIFSIRDFKALIDVAEGTEWPDGSIRNAGVGFLPMGWQEMRILHDPIEWNAEQEAAKEAAEKEADRQANLEAERLLKAASEPAVKPKGRPKKV